MRFRLAAALLAALVAVAASGSAAPVRGAFHGPPRVTQTVLPNGLRVVVVEDHLAPLAHVAMWYRYGSTGDPPGHFGTAHALEHMMFRGTHVLPGANAFDLVGARLGFDANAETDFESTHYYETVPVDGLAVALRIEADRMRNLLLRPRDWELERRAVLAELSGDQSSAVDALENAVRAAAYGASPFGRDRIGTRHDLLRTTVADLRRAYDAAYRPDNATLVVAGDVEPAAVLALARTWFGPLYGHAHAAAVRTERVAARGFVVRLPESDMNVVDVALESHGGEAADAFAEGVAAELLGPEHAALRTALVDAGPCTWYDVDDDTQLYGGLYHIVCHLGYRARPATAIRAIRRGLRTLAAHPPMGAAVGYARRAIIVGTAYARDSLTSEAYLFGASIALQQTDPRRADLETAHVTDAQVAAVLRRWAEPVGVGIATRTSTFSEGYVPARRTRTEHVPPAAGDREEAGIDAAWARAAMLPARTRPSPPVEAFALPNGLRVFVEPRRGNGTVYVRAGVERRSIVRAAEDAQSERIDSLAERHAIVVTRGTSLDMHGFARDLPTMLGLVAGVWRSPRTSLRPEQAWLVVVGDVGPLAVRARVTQSFAGWRAAGPPSPQPSATPPMWLSRNGQNRMLTLHVGTPSAVGMLVQPAPGRDDPDSAAMTILNEILGENGDFDSALMREVRVRRGLAYSVGSLYEPADKVLMIMFESPRRDFSATRAAVRAVVERLHTGAISAADAARARHKLVAKALRDESDVSRILERLSAAAREHRAPDDVAALAARYDAVTLDDLRRVARTRLTPDAMAEFAEGQFP